MGAGYNDDDTREVDYDERERGYSGENQAGGTDAERQRGTGANVPAMFYEYLGHHLAE